MKSIFEFHFLLAQQSTKCGFARAFKLVWVQQKTSRFFIAHDKNVCHLLKLISGHKRTKISNVKFSHSRHDNRK